MFIRTAVDLGALIKERRKLLDIDQAELAKTIGVGRQWVIAIERGRPGAEIGLVMRALDSLGVRLTAMAEDASTGRTNSAIDEIINSAKKSSP